MNDILVDESALRSIEDAVGATAMAQLMAAMLSDARHAAKSLDVAMTSGGVAAQAREAHRLGGLFAQFGCPAIAKALKEASHAPLSEVAQKVESSLAFLPQTLAHLARLYASASSQS